MEPGKDTSVDQGPEGPTSLGNSVEIKMLTFNERMAKRRELEAMRTKLLERFKFCLSSRPCGDPPAKAQ